MCFRLEPSLGKDVWDLSPVQVLWRHADLVQREAARDRLAAVTARVSQAEQKDFEKFVQNLGD